MNEKIRVLLVDDHRIFRDGVVSMFERSEDIIVAGLASNGKEALAEMEELKPDVVVLDLSMQEMGGLEFLRILKAIPDKPEILILSMHSDLEFVTEALSLGARGYVCKEDTDMAELEKAIRKVYQKREYFGKTIHNLMQQRFLSHIKSSSPNEHEPGIELLTKREREILKMVMEGMSNQEIAERTFVSIRTVETHKNNIMTKLNLKNTVELVKYAIRKRFFDL